MPRKNDKFDYFVILRNAYVNFLFSLGLSKKNYKNNTHSISALKGTTISLIGDIKPQLCPNVKLNIKTEHIWVVAGCNNFKNYYSHKNDKNYQYFLKLKQSEL